MLQSTAQEKSALFAATLSSFMPPFMISSVNVALPAIQNELGINAVQLSWVATSYLLALGVALIPAGRIGDIFGRKMVFNRGLVLFTTATFLLIFSHSFESLIVLRVLQGFGSAMYVPTGMAILTSVFPPQERGRVIGIYVTAVYIGLTVGPFAGGILTQQFGWRSIFLISAPFGIASVYITMKHIHDEWADARGETLDITGSIIYGISIMALVYGASVLPDAKALFLVVGGIVGICAFIWLQLKVPYPVFEVRMFQGNRLFAFSSLAALIHYSATFAIAFFISLYLQYIKGLTPQTAGLILVPQPVMMALFSPLAGKLSDTIEPRKIASSGIALTALGLFLFVFLDHDTGIFWIAVNLAMIGLGFALFSSPNMNAIMGSVEKKFYGLASGTVATMRLLGQMSSMAVAMIVFAVFIGREEISPANYSHFLKSARIAFLIFGLLCTLGIQFSLFRGKLRTK
ncbi:MFS transporter [Thermodesulfobacteriota bacterium]